MGVTQGIQTKISGHCGYINPLRVARLSVSSSGFFPTLPNSSSTERLLGSYFKNPPGSGAEPHCHLSDSDWWLLYYSIYLSYSMQFAPHLPILFNLYSIPSNSYKLFFVIIYFPKKVSFIYNITTILHFLYPTRHLFTNYSYPVHNASPTLI
jgi:hypothetical protein